MDGAKEEKVSEEGFCTAGRTTRLLNRITETGKGTDGGEGEGGEVFYSNTAQQGKQGVRGSHFIICWGTEGSGYWVLFLNAKF